MSETRQEAWFQRWGDAEWNERFVIFKEDEDGQEMVTEEEERVFRGGWTEISLYK